MVESTKGSTGKLGESRGRKATGLRRKLCQQGCQQDMLSFLFAFSWRFFLELLKDEQMCSAKDNVLVKADSSIRQYYGAALISIWFGQAIDSYKSCEQRLDLKPHAALCLLIMAVERVASSRDIEIHLSRFGGGPFDRVEAKIVAECGLYSLHENGYVRLDAKGKKELEEHAHENYGLGTVQWLLTAKAAKTIVPSYCTCKGLESSEQAQAVKDILAANKVAVAEGRKNKSA